MTKELDTARLTIKMWLHARQISDMLKTCIELALMRYQITAEQYDVLASVKYRSGRVRISDIAVWLRRSPNSISMIVDRMVKAGLVKRVRDRIDRRLVYVFLTAKGENILELTGPVCWQTIAEIVSPLSYEDRATFLSLLKTLDQKTLEYLNPGEAVEELQRKQAKDYADLMKLLPDFVRVSSPKSRHHTVEKAKAAR